MEEIQKENENGKWNGSYYILVVYGGYTPHLTRLLLRLPPSSKGAICHVNMRSNAMVDAKNLA